MLCNFCGQDFLPERLVPWPTLRGVVLQVCDLCAPEAAGVALAPAEAPKLEEATCAPSS